MKKFAALLLCAIPFAEGQSATSYVAVFDGADTSGGPVPLPSIGWTQNHPGTINGPMAYVYHYVDLEDGGATKNGAFVGGYSDAPTTSPDQFLVWRTFSDLDLSDTKVSFELAIQDSTNDFGGLFTARDTFGFSLRDALGATLLTVDLVALSQTNDPDNDLGGWELWYSFGSDPLQSALHWLPENDPGGFGSFTDFLLETTATGVGFTFNSSAGGPTFNSDALGYDVAAGDLTLEFHWKKQTEDPSAEWGNNYMFLRNLDVVPEPSSLLLACFGGLALFRRRRA